MVIQVRGTSENNNKSAHATATLAAIGALKASRKSLILQFCNGVPIEEMLIGKRKAQTEITGDFMVNEDTGIDPILLGLNSQRMQKEQFDLWCDHALKMENMLDIASQTTRPELFESELLDQEENISSLLEQAQEIYDDVYMYVNGKNEQVCEMFNKFSDAVIICIRQGNKEKIAGAPKDALYLITNYDEDSMFSKRYIKNLYKMNKIAVMPYCVEYKDAYNNGTLVNFIHKNLKINENDITYNFMTKITEVANSYLIDKKDNDDMTVYDPDPMELLENFICEPVELEEYETPDVEIVEVKTGFFGNKTAKKIAAGPHGVDKDFEENSKTSYKKNKKYQDDDEELIEDDVEELIEEDNLEEFEEEDEMPVKKSRKEKRAEAKAAKEKAKLDKKRAKLEKQFKYADEDLEDDEDLEELEEDLEEFEEIEEEPAPKKKKASKDVKKTAKKMLEPEPEEEDDEEELIEDDEIVEDEDLEELEEDEEDFEEDFEEDDEESEDEDLEEEDDEDENIDSDDDDEEEIEESEEDDDEESEEDDEDESEDESDEDSEETAKEELIQVNKPVFAEAPIAPAADPVEEVPAEVVEEAPVRRHRSSRDRSDRVERSERRNSHSHRESRDSRDRRREREEQPTTPAPAPAPTPAPEPVKEAEPTAKPAPKQSEVPRRSHSRNMDFIPGVSTNDFKAQMDEAIDRELHQQEMQNNPVKEPDETWTCPKCGKYNSKKFCSECGTAKPETHNPKESEWLCLECGSRNLPKDKFCSECGTQKPNFYWN